METNKSHGEMLEPTMRDLHQKFSNLALSDEYFDIIFHRYLTTPAEFFFLRNEIEDMHVLTNMLQQKVTNFLEGARAIIAEREN